MNSGVLPEAQAVDLMKVLVSTYVTDSICHTAEAYIEKGLAKERELFRFLNASEAASQVSREGFVAGDCQAP